MKHIRKRLTYANVMSSIAAFLVLGGATAFAAQKFGANNLKPNSVTTAKIKKESVTTAKIKKDAVTGAKVKESTLGQVPSAANATNSVNANNANTVGGQTVTKIFAKLNIGQTNVVIASFAGFVITATCNGPVENLVLHAPGNVASAVESQGNGNEGPVAEQDNGLGNISITLNKDGINENVRGTATFNGATTGGTVVSGNMSFEDSKTFEGEEVCAFFGEVVSG